jgi:aminomethyltransferase
VIIVELVRPVKLFEELRSMSKGTPFYERTSQLCKSNDWRRWSGYFSAVSYGDFVQPEYAAIRHSAALFDVSPLYKYALEGPDAAALADKVFTHDLGNLPSGMAIYTPWCDSRGKIRQEGTVFRLGENEYQVNAADPAFRWLTTNSKGFDVVLTDRSTDIAAVALQGPKSRDILVEAGADVADLKFFGIREAQIGTIPVSISRTGYTGDLGYEVWVNAEHAIPMWDALMEAGAPHQITPSGLMALDMSRIEAGFILIGVDYHNADSAIVEDDKVNPYEVGLGWTVKLAKENFVGKKALQAEKAAGPKRKTVGLEIDWQPMEDLYLAANQMPDLPLTTCRDPVPVYSTEGAQIGRVTTRIWSTLLKKYIGIALIDSRFAKPGTMVDMEVTVQYQRKRAPAKVVKPQFYRPARAKA